MLVVIRSLKVTFWKWYIPFGQKIGTQGKPFASLHLVLLPTKLTKPLVSSNVALEWRGLFCTADLHAHFFSPPLLPELSIAAAGGRSSSVFLEANQVDLSMRRSGCPTAYIRPFFPATTTTRKPRELPPQPQTTTSASTNSSTTSSTNTISTNTNCRPYVASSSKFTLYGWVIVWCHLEMCHITFYCQSNEKSKFTGWNQLPLHRKQSNILKTYHWERSFALSPRPPLLSTLWPETKYSDQYSPKVHVWA